MLRPKYGGHWGYYKWLWGQLRVWTNGACRFFSTEPVGWRRVSSPLPRLASWLPLCCAWYGTKLLIIHPGYWPTSDRHENRFRVSNFCLPPHIRSGLGATADYHTSPPPFTPQVRTAHEDQLSLLRAEVDDLMIRSGDLAAMARKETQDLEERIQSSLETDKKVGTGYYSVVGPARTIIAFLLLTAPGKRRQCQRPHKYHANP